MQRVGTVTRMYRVAAKSMDTGVLHAHAGVLPRCTYWLDPVHNRWDGRSACGLSARQRSVRRQELVIGSDKRDRRKLCSQEDAVQVQGRCQLYSVIAPQLVTSREFDGSLNEPTTHSS